MNMSMLSITGSLLLPVWLASAAQQADFFTLDVKE